MTALADNAPFHVVAPAGAYFRVMTANLGKIPESTRMVLQRDVGGSPLAWALALVLAGWRRVVAGGELPSQFASSGADKLVGQVKQFSSALPKAFVSFLEAADRGEDGAAGSYFEAALTGLPDYARPVLNSWLSSQGFIDASRQLIETIGSAPKPTAKKKAGGTQYTINPGKPDKADKTAILVGRLAKAGWNQQEIERILKGPDKAHLTAERVYRQIAANQPDVQMAITSRLKAPVEATEDLGHVDDEHLTGSRARLTSADELLAEYDALPTEQQKRLLMLLQKKPIQTPEARPKGTSPASSGSGSGGSEPKTATSDTGRIAETVKSGIDLARETINRILGSVGKSEGGKSGGGQKSGGGPSPGRQNGGQSKGKGKGAETDSNKKTDTRSDTEEKEGTEEGDDSDESRDRGDDNRGSLPDDDGGDDGGGSLPDDGGGDGESSLPDEMPPPQPSASTPDIPIIDDSADVVD